MSPRSSQRVDRRRRVLTDESRNEDAPRPRIFRGDDEGPLSRYSEAALRAINAPIAKYIPLRPFSLLVWFLLGLIPILGLMLLDQQRFQLAEFLGADALRIFDFTAPGSLASWSASMAFAVAIPVILGIYSVRRHRRDDYRARFAVWQWVIFVALLASVDSAVGLHRLFQGACEKMLGVATWGNGSAWWIGAWTILVGLTMLRLAFEMSESRKSIGWMLGGAACYLWCTLVETNVGRLDESSLAHGSQFPMLLLGHHCVLFALVNYARYVVREAMGMIEAPAAKPKAKQDTTPAKTANRTAAKDEQPVAKSTPQVETTKPATAKAAKKTGPLAAKFKPASAEADTSPVMKIVHEDGAEEVDLSTLSKAERRRLRKEQKQQRRKAA